jgi:histone demethylase JARID1
MKYLKAPLPGVNVPWLYIGMLFSTFCWHNEDNYFYSINYSHCGKIKQWYGVPGSKAKAFETVSKDILFQLFKEVPDLLHQMSTQIPPSRLLVNGVPVFSAQQEAGTFIVTFPKAFHSGFSYGLNIGEAVNFATADWIPSGGEAEERYRHFGRTTVLSHQRFVNCCA